MAFNSKPVKRPAGSFGAMLGAFGGTFQDNHNDSDDEEKMAGILKAEEVRKSVAQLCPRPFGTQQVPFVVEKNLDCKADQTLGICAVTQVAMEVEEALRDEFKRGDEAAVKIESNERVEINATGLNEQSSNFIVDSEVAVGKEKSTQSVTSSCKLPVSSNMEDTSKTNKATFSEFSLPLPLSRMYAKKNQKKKGHKQECSGGRFGELVSTSCSHEQDSATKTLGHQLSAALACVKPTHKLDMECTTVIEPYDYAAAKQKLGFGKSLASQHEKLATGAAVLQGGKRTGKLKSENHSSADTSFDPLRRMKSELKVQDLKPGKRRQVFPQSGNRSGTFW